MFGGSSWAVNVITWLIHFAFNEAECLGMQQLKHCTFGEEKKEKKERQEFPVGIVGCRRYNSCIYTECVENNSREGFGVGTGHRCSWILSKTFLHRIENTGRWELTPHVQLQAGTTTHLYCWRRQFNWGEWAGNMKISVFWNAELCSLVETYRRFRCA
jgi:hypothetical protein